MTLIELCEATPCHPRSDSLSLLASGVFGRAERDLRKVFRLAPDVQARPLLALRGRRLRRVPARRAAAALLTAAALGLTLERGEQRRAHGVDAALRRPDGLDAVRGHGLPLRGGGRGLAAG